ncbi:CDP-alcohol phosphatidyltransferase family protein [Candidatus Woesearchaeota archaeon]|jgi:phosphatidylglycerophosphate synthase|nr:CDP-alcohol phosphatidyltransferase family protein [Candidatus Woesearchaeota archaeon]MBT7367634.1 CDP-alcohol phosphatidyltransferase family protein [Candidatus Woesearchaeota archaeon]
MKQKKEKTHNKTPKNTGKIKQKKLSFSKIKSHKRDPKRMAKISHYFYQPIADLFTWLFLNMNMTPNQVSVIMVLLSLVAAVLGFIPTKTCILLAIGSHILSMIIDHSDGMVATITKQFSKVGGYLDHLHHVIEITTVFLGVGVYTYFFEKNILFLYLGIFTTIGLLALIYLRDMFLFVTETSIMKDHIHRKLPIVLVYGEFFKMWLPIIFIMLIFNLGSYVLYVSSTWILTRAIVLPIYYYIKIKEL